MQFYGVESVSLYTEFRTIFYHEDGVGFYNVLSSYCQTAMETEFAFHSIEQ
jgi:hypothetical protein